MSILLMTLLWMADLSGVWTLREAMPRGEVVSRIELRQEKDKLIGFAEAHPMWQGRNRVEGKVKDSRVQFEIIIEIDGREMVQTYDGRLGADGVIGGTGRFPGVKRWQFTATKE